MVIRIAKKEWKEQLREKRFLAAGLLMALLFAAALISSKAYYEKEQDLRLQAQQGIEENWFNQRDKNPHGAAHYGIYLFKPESRLALIDRGVNRYAGTAFFVEGHVRNEAQFRKIEDETGLVRFGELTPAYILIYLMPLFIILIGFNAFTKEREGGTWKMLQSHNVPISKLLFGKWAGVTFTVLILFIPLFMLMGLIIYSVSGFGEFSLTHYLILGAFYTLYYLIFINLTLIVSWFSKHSGAAFITLLAIWIIATLVVPKLFVSAAQYLNPLPDTNAVAEMYSEARAGGIDGHAPSSARELERQVMDEHGVDSLEELPFNFAGYRLQAGEEYDTKAYNYVFSHIHTVISDQDAIIRRGSLLSPFLPVRNLSKAMAYTDVNNHWDFSEAVELYRQDFVLYLNEDLMYSSRTGETYLAGSDVWAAKPGFSYELPGMDEVMKAQAGNIFLLLGWVGLSFLALFMIRQPSEEI